MKSVFSRAAVVMKQSLMLAGCIFILSGAAVSRSAETSAGELQPAEVRRMGERLYRDGLLPTGEPVQASIRDDVKVSGDAFSCVSCHLRSGIGSMEGQVLTPPTNGTKLYKPYYQYPPMTPDPDKPKKSMMDKSAAKPIYRPAYTDETLAAAIVDGVDPLGRKLNSVMPRYYLEGRDMGLLIAYLKSLSSEVSPGADAKTIRFATVIAGDVPAAERAEMLAMVNNIIDHHNRKTKRFNRRAGDRDAPFNYPQFTLSRWELKGPPHTWREQLDEFYRREPVFALLGGLSAGDWLPMHEFSEQNRIPCLLPVTDLPVISDRDWYTLYFNKGAYQEGEASARHLARRFESSADSDVIQIVEDSPRAKAVAHGFQTTWQELGRGVPLTVNLPAGAGITGETLLRHAGGKGTKVILLWTGAGTLASLETVAGKLGEGSAVYVSTTLLRQDVKAIPGNARKFTFISYPYKLSEETEFSMKSARSQLLKANIPVSAARISTRLYSLYDVLLDPFRVVKRHFNPEGLGRGQVTIEEQFESLMHVRRNYYRDYLFDVIGMMPDKLSLDYERLSFGPGQRYASKGCYIVQLSEGPAPELIRQSEWVIH